MRENRMKSWKADGKIIGIQLEKKSFANEFREEINFLTRLIAEVVLIRS